MTNTANLFTETTPTNTQFGTNTLTLDYLEIKAEIEALNLKLNKNLPVLDTIEDNFEKLFHALLMLIKLREIDNNNSGFNIKVGDIQHSQGLWNNTQKPQKTYPIRLPFGGDSENYGDSDNIG